MIPENLQTVKSKPPYLLGLLCLIPLIGAFVGFGLLLFGIFQYKDKWLIAIGAFGIVFTVAIYGALFYASTSSFVADKGWSQLSQHQLNSLIRDVEFYKLENGEYPDSLTQLEKGNPLVGINDPVQGLNSGSNTYIYERVNGKYLLFSPGIDGKANTKDDLYPQITITDTSKIGWIKYK
ncbi:MAG: hypothetical protein ABIN95_11670 [Mucilaginibacter sp.]